MDTEILWKVENETDEESNEDTSEDILEEIKEEKKYSSSCRQCNLYMEAQKKYALIQQIKKHTCMNKKSAYLNTCTDCEYQAKSKILLKRHRRDIHEKMTNSTSPPPKKAKIKKASKEEENMEIDCTNDRRADIEDMEIEPVETDEQIRSKMMDEKVISKAKEQEEKEKVYELKRKIFELEKKTEEENKSQSIKQNNKKRKQEVKDVKKKLRRQNSKKNTPRTNIKNNIPNLKPVPSNCVKLVNKGDIVYKVPGNLSVGCGILLY